MYDEVTQLLFAHDFPREAGKKRTLCRNKREFEYQIDMLNGVDECFTNVNPINGSINDIFFDFDDPYKCKLCGFEGHKDIMVDHFKASHLKEYETYNKNITRFVTPLQLSLGEAQQLYTHLLSKNIPTFDIASGKKGIHFHCRFATREGEDNKAILYKTTKSLLLGCFGADKNSIIQSKCIDTHLVGNVRALCRVTNTLRPPENQSYCTLLPPKKAFLEMNLAQLKSHTKSIHTYPLSSYDYDPQNLPKFEDFILPEVEQTQLSFEEPKDATQIPIFTDNALLKWIGLRPCLQKLITVSEPRHPVRIATAADLKRADFTTREICAIFRTLNWVDWSEEYTNYQIERVRPIYWSRNTMLKKGICYRCGRCN